MRGSPPLKALGSIICTEQREPSVNEIYTPLMDYYDMWSEIDPRISEHDSLSFTAEVFSQDLVNIATFAHEILRWLEPSRIRCPESVVVVGAMTEGFLVSTRSAADGLAVALAYLLPLDGQQCPKTLRKFISWVQKNPKRVRPESSRFEQLGLEWFWNLRSLRDHLVHNGVHANIHCDGRQFNLWMHCHSKGWVTREPLLPLLSSHFQGLMNFADEIGRLALDIVGLPEDRRRTRILHGVRIQSLHDLVARAPEFSAASP